jgi:two-component system chemotaxis response regulator CheY
MDTSLNVLVVDDSSTMRRIVKGVLLDLGFTDIVEADNGWDAWERIKQGGIGLAICDWNMPRMTGIELLNAVRSHPEHKNLPFVMLTAEGQTQSILKAVRSQVSQYLMKPFTGELLVRKIKRALSNSQ